MPADKTTLKIIVNGTEVEIEQNSNAPLKSVVAKALADSGNVGQGPENWELRDADGNVLDLDKKISEFDFSDGTELFLSLKAGVAGL